MPALLLSTMALRHGRASRKGRETLTVEAMGRAGTWRVAGWKQVTEETPETLGQAEKVERSSAMVLLISFKDTNLIGEGQYKVSEVVGSAEAQRYGDERLAPRARVTGVGATVGCYSRGPARFAVDGLSCNWESGVEVVSDRRTEHWHTETAVQSPILNHIYEWKMKVEHEGHLQLGDGKSQRLVGVVVVQPSNLIIDVCMLDLSRHQLEPRAQHRAVPYTSDNAAPPHYPEGRLESTEEFKRYSQINMDLRAGGDRISECRFATISSPSALNFN
ncbi:hypothetical protein BKA70DRAFT_1398495 [Coprinopsis sp. MPI-PUGE-AT-0042]|nr:hypothetical protein BKA70DRAFT_1398495 [Coprinopsis sp. MPI-PUGE-AT-0042]